MSENGQSDNEWQGIDSVIGRLVREQSQRTIDVYRSDKRRVQEDAGIEREILLGGYGHRQVFELVQNGADAILESQRHGMIHVLLTEEALYCANEGSPIAPDGVETILMAFMSSKRGDSIGRFGLGFKSVLAVTDGPHFYSRSGSFRFDREWSRQRISEVLPSPPDETPVLRLAQPADPRQAAAEDAVLAELMGWASSVVKLPLRNGASERVSNDLNGFPPEFLLFSPHVRSLELEDRVVQKACIVETTSEPPCSIRLKTDGQDSVWAVFKASVKVESLSDPARQTCHKLFPNRRSLPIAWAVPAARKERGRFWAFFPTAVEMSLGGILNAPWQTTPDHQHIEDDALNREIMREAALLVANNSVCLATQDDPGRLLDFLPSRDDTVSLARSLSEGVYSRLAAMECVPISGGGWALPAHVRLRPDVVRQEEVTKWLKENPTADSAGRFCHPTVETRERRPRAQRMGCREATIREWLEAVAKEATVEASIRAITLADAILKAEPWRHRAEVEQSRFVLTASDKLVAPEKEGLFLDTPAGEQDGVEFVHAEILENESARLILQKQFVLQPHTPEGRFTAFLRTVPQTHAPDSWWGEFWRLAGELVPDDAHTLIRKLCPIRICAKTVGGRFRSIRKTLLPGGVIPSGETDRDKDVAIDAAYHARTLELVTTLGVVDSPHAGIKAEADDEWFAKYHDDATVQFRDGQPPGTRSPQPGCLDFAGEKQTWGPLDPLLRLCEMSRATFTAILLPAACTEQRWTMRHSDRRHYLPVEIDEPPLLWTVRQYGRLKTSLGPRTVKQSVGPQLKDWRSVLPVADCTVEQAAKMKLRASTAELDDLHWTEAFAHAETLTEMQTIARLYAEAARHRPNAPARVRCRVGVEWGLRPACEVHVAANRSALNALAERGTPALLVADTEADERLVRQWGMQPAPDVRIAWTGEGPEEPLLDHLPGLEKYLPHAMKALMLVPCADLWSERSGTTDGLVKLPLDCARDGNRLLYRDSLDDRVLLSGMVLELGIAVAAPEMETILRYLERDDRQRLVHRIKGCADDAARLLEAIGVDGLRNRIPPDYLPLMAEQDPATRSMTVARLALAVYGVEVLREYRAELDAAGLNPPAKWAGTRRARAFTQEFGFPSEFAGFPSMGRDPYVEVDGPPEIKPLHAFQETICARIRNHLLQQPPSRGLLALPTGSGKTRVVVEAIVRVLKESCPRGHILWASETDELCEQAVQTWSDVWRALGSRQQLRISRLWGNTSDRVENSAVEHHVVVATYQLLGRRVIDATFGWVFNDSRCVVIDEAHRAIVPTYTDVLARMGLRHGETNRPLIGMTATPYRTDEDETRRLAGRFDNVRFDNGVFAIGREQDVYSHLQERGVLAFVDHHKPSLDGGDLTLDQREIDYVEQYHVLPSSAEGRLAADSARNERLLRCLCELPPTWSVVVFATSLEHARLLAVSLRMRGVPAQSIASSTPLGARRYYIDEFRSGRLRVLTNYGVLTTGFDAPAVRAICIARPVWSPGLYQQMIGRGLRGPLNGGTDRCLIINVKDNIRSTVTSSRPALSVV